MRESKSYKEYSYNKIIIILIIMMRINHMNNPHVGLFSKNPIHSNLRDS